MPNCLFCGKQFIQGKNTYGKYCSNACQGQHRSKEVYDAWFNDQCAKTFYNAGQTLRPAIRAALIKEYQCKCVRCGWSEKHPTAILPALEINHIDGNWLNCKKDNLEVICPNCHSLTDSYKARNTGKGRGYRRDQ